MKETENLWKEAHILLNAYEWRMLLPADVFLDRFHPYARESKAVSRLLSGACQIWLMAVTLGGALEQRSREYFAQNRSFHGFILDRMGSFLVEEKMRELDGKITRECADNGDSATRRYSPGYQDFSLEAQRVFIELIGTDIPDLALTTGFLLKPEKTITALKGVLRADPAGA